jgi:hypothetical protein
MEYLSKEKIFRYRLDVYNATYQRLSSDYLLNNRQSPDTINAMYRYLDPGIYRRFKVDVHDMAHFLLVYFYTERIR